MEAETPNPTLEELRLAGAIVNGNLAAAEEEMVRRLKALLPAAIVDYNAEKGLTGNHAVPPITGVDISPTVLVDGHIGKVLIKTSLTTETSGGGTFKNSVNVEIFWVNERITRSKQSTTAWHQAEVIARCLYWFLNGVVNANGVKAWRQLIPNGFSRMEGEWAKDFSGTNTKFFMVLARGQ
jgi:hypothetical protein